MLAICKVGGRMVVPGAHLARRVLAALGVCVGYMCWLYVKYGAWGAPGARGEWPL